MPGSWGPGDGCPALRSGGSIDEPPLNFSLEPATSDTGPALLKSAANQSILTVDEQTSPCAKCQDVLKDPVSTSCGHWFSSECISSHLDPSEAPGDSSCFQGGQRCRPANGQRDPGLQKVLEEHKIDLGRRFEHVSEGTGETGSRNLNTIYTEVHVTEGRNEEFNNQREETRSKKNVNDAAIKPSQIFKSFSDPNGHTRVVLTYGVAGVGKTVSVQKFTLDWAQGVENQDLRLLILFSFRELNLIRHEEHSLLTLLRVFHPTLQEVTAQTLADCRPLFIFDGLDESRPSLDFVNRKLVSDVTVRSSLNDLLTNLIQGNLLPSARVWITSRPAAANQIPPGCLDRVTEVRGFTDAQKLEYFRKRSVDEERTNAIISHIQTSRTLHIMCQIPVFCWISATVLDHMLTSDQKGEVPDTLTDLYSQFLLAQTKRKNNKYQGLMEADGDLLLKLGRLAFEHLQVGNIIFYQEDLERCGLDVTEATVYSGVCTEMFRAESVIFNQTVYSFVHLSVQVFLASIYAFHCNTHRKNEVLKLFLKDLGKRVSRDGSLDDLMNRAVEKSHCHPDLFVRFLHGLSLETNQSLLRPLLGHTEKRPGINRLAKCGLSDSLGDGGLSSEVQPVATELSGFLKQETTHTQRH